MAVHNNHNRDIRSGIGRIIKTGAQNTGMHRRVEWMTAADDAILNLINQSNISLTPSVIAHNLGYNRDYIANRCRTLKENGLVEVAEDSGGPFYDLTTLGIRYVRGEIDAEELEQGD